MRDVLTQQRVIRPQLVYEVFQGSEWKCTSVSMHSLGAGINRIQKMETPHSLAGDELYELQLPCPSPLFAAVTSFLAHTPCNQVAMPVAAHRVPKCLMVPNANA